MTQSYRNITAGQARLIKLVMTDVDGTLTPGGDIGNHVIEAIRRLEGRGINVGLVSGRTMPELEALAGRLGISGPVIAENGGVAKLKAGGPPLALGYSRRPALEALNLLETAYPGRITGRADNRERLIDIVFRADGIPAEELKRLIGDTQLLDSGYIMHLMQAGISKGDTLTDLLSRAGDGNLTPETVLVIGDSATDRSLFEQFPNNILVLNPRIAGTAAELPPEAARYITEEPCGDGFVSAVNHILKLI